MNILITSYYYYPELTPRAFRTHELVKEFLRCGHDVTLFLPKKQCYQTHVEQQHRLRIIYVNEINGLQKRKKGSCIDINKDVPGPNNRTAGISFFRMLKNIMPEKTKQQIKDFREWKAKYFYPLHKKAFIRPLSNALAKEQETYDFIISIGLPVEVHVGTAMGIMKNKKLRKIPVTIADYGDPFSRGNIFPGYQLVDFFIAKVFRHITVPTEIAVSAYTRFKHKKKIHVIPQGFNLSDYEVVGYTPNDVPTFAYAGCFYLDIRNPALLFDYLKTIEKPFKFVIYTIRESSDTNKIIHKYKPDFGDKLQIVYNTPRKRLIKMLSKMDFLINIKNSTQNQLPSKLIDYAIAGRPILSISPTNFDQSVFEQFIKGNYENQKIIELGQHDIKVLTKSFLKLR